MLRSNLKDAIGKNEGLREMKVNAHIPAGQLKAYSDKELDKTEQERVRAHLVDCTHCQEQLERMTSLTRQVQDRFAILAPSSSQVHHSVSTARASAMSDTRPPVI